MTTLTKTATKTSKGIKVSKPAKQTKIAKTINPKPVKTVTIGSPNVSYTFTKPTGKINLKTFDNVLTKLKNDFKKLLVSDWGDLMMADESISNHLKTDNANDVANRDPRFDPARMGKTGTTKLGVFFYDEEIQRLMDSPNFKRLIQQFDISFFTCVFCVIYKDKKMNYTKGKTTYHNTIDGWHHLIALYLQLRAGNIKGWDPEDWADFPVPTQTWETDDPTFAGRLALMVNGEGQKGWGEFEYIRIHSNNYRLYSQSHPDKITSEDKIAYDQVMACLVDGNSVLMSTNHKQAKNKGAVTHVDAVRNNKDVDRLKFIMSQHEKWWPHEERSSAMFGFYGNIYDEFVRNNRPMKGQAFDDQMLAYNYIIQHVFGNLSGAMKAVAGKYGALTKLQTLSNQGWKAPSSDNALLAMIEIIYMDYLKGTQRISAARGSFVWTNTKRQQTNIVDALQVLPNTGAGFAQKISTL
jgi:hypothetical protein